MCEKFISKHIVAKSETLASIAEGYLGPDGAQQVGTIVNANPWLKDTDQSGASGNGYYSGRRVIKGWDRNQSDVPANAVLNISDVLLKDCLLGCGLAAAAARENIGGVLAKPKVRTQQRLSTLTKGLDFHTNRHLTIVERRSHSAAAHLMIGSN